MGMRQLETGYTLAVEPTSQKTDYLQTRWSPYTDLGKPKDALDDEKGMLNLGAHTRLPTVLLALTFRQSSIAKPLLVPAFG